MTTFKNFDTIAKELIASASSQKAHDFACKIANQVADKGEAWIEAHASELAVRKSASEQSEFTVTANRLWFLAQWQVALAK